MLIPRRAFPVVFAIMMSVPLSPNAAPTFKVSFDKMYDNDGLTMTKVACSDGRNGLITRKQYRTLGDIRPGVYPGAASGVAGWNSPQCGTCWRLDYKGKSIKVLAVDAASEGFLIPLAGMNNLTGGQAEKYGSVAAQATQIDAKDCGM